MEQSQQRLTYATPGESLFEIDADNHGAIAVEPDVRQIPRIPAAADSCRLRLPRTAEEPLAARAFGPVGASTGGKSSSKGCISPASSAMKSCS